MAGTAATAADPRRRPCPTRSPHSTTSVDRLAALVGPLEPATLTVPAYPTEWTIADTLSHLGSGAVIFLRLARRRVAGVETPGDAFPAVWDEWNAKSPTDQAADALVADRALLDRLEGLDDEDRDRVHVTLGPMTVDFDGLVGLRLNEHALHTWDVEVALDPSATVAARADGSVVDDLERFAGFTARPTGTERPWPWSPPTRRAASRSCWPRRGDALLVDPVDDPRRGAAGRGLHPPRLRPSRPRPHARGGGRRGTSRSCAGPSREPDRRVRPRRSSGAAIRRRACERRSPRRSSADISSPISSAGTGHEK